MEIKAKRISYSYATWKLSEMIHFVIDHVIAFINLKKVGIKTNKKKCVAYTLDLTLKSLSSSNLLLNIIMNKQKLFFNEDIPVLETDQEGKLRGGFCALGGRKH